MALAASGASGDASEAAVPGFSKPVFKPSNAVLVIGASGRQVGSGPELLLLQGLGMLTAAHSHSRTGRQLVKQVVESGRDVIAGVRDLDRGRKFLVEELGADLRIS